MREHRLWLIGHGVGGSPSPAMQNAALRAAGLGGEYTVMDVDAPALPAVLERLRRGEATGANVTIPHKLAAAAACDALEGDALPLGAVNCLVVEEGRLIGANTDAGGLEAALRQGGLWPSSDGGRALVLGAGGAARATALALARLPFAHLTVVARDGAAAAEVAGIAAAHGVAGVGCTPWADAPAIAAAVRAADILVNATPLGLPQLPLAPRDLPESCTVVDLRYRPRPVDLVAVAAASGRRSMDGLEMLLQQGMLAFTRWTGVEPPWEAARLALLEAVSA